MNRKELKKYADAMDKKLDYHYYHKYLHRIKDERINSASRLKLNLISKLKEDYDLIVDSCLRRREGNDPTNWFDIYIPQIPLSIKICKDKEEREVVFSKWKRLSIVLLEEGRDNLNSSLEQIVDKMVRMSMRKKRK